MGNTTEKSEIYSDYFKHFVQQLEQIPNDYRDKILKKAIKKYGAFHTTAIRKGMSPRLKSRRAFNRRHKPGGVNRQLKFHAGTSSVPRSRVRKIIVSDDEIPSPIPVKGQPKIPFEKSNLFSSTRIEGSQMIENNESKVNLQNSDFSNHSTPKVSINEARESYCEGKTKKVVNFFEKMKFFKFSYNQADTRIEQTAISTWDKSPLNPIAEKGLKLGVTSQASEDTSTDSKKIENKRRSVMKNLKLLGKNVRNSVARKKSSDKIIEPNPSITSGSN